MKIILSLFLILICSIPAVLPFFRAGFFPTHDYIYIARVFAASQALADGQFPLRWVSDFRYGEPLFNFYAPFPYYLGGIIHFLGFDYLTTVKILFISAIVLSGIFMYIFVRCYFGNLAGILAALFYIYAPYHAVDVYVRGALSETWGLVFFPLIFLSFYKFSQKNNRLWFVLASLFYGLLILTHNILAIMFSPFLLAYIIFLSIIQRNRQIFLKMILIIILGLTFSASYSLPAFFEKNLVQASRITADYFNFRAHFVEIRQFFIFDWGYGGSIWGGKDGLSFQIGLLHWIMVLITPLIGIFYLKKNLRLSLWIFFLMAMFVVSLFMQHNRSTPLWVILSPMAFIQFPWRFLALSIFFTSILAAVFIYFLERENKKILLWTTSLLLAIGLFFSGINFFHPKEYYSNVNDNDYISQRILLDESKLPWDYLPIWAKKPTPQKITRPFSSEGEIKIDRLNMKSNYYSFEVNVEKTTNITIPVFYFPGWQILIDDKESPIEEPEDYGLLKFKIGSGQHSIKAIFLDSPIRQTGNILSIITLLILSGLLITHFQKKKI